MARPSKAIGKTTGHRTKQEIAQREAAEKAAFTGIPMREAVEVAADPIAHAEFERVVELLSATGKNDALLESVINDYCILKSDIVANRVRRAAVDADLAAIDANEKIDVEEKYNIKTGLLKMLLAFDKNIAAAQKKRFDIEKENGFTLASALRAIPKKSETAVNPLVELLAGG